MTDQTHLSGNFFVPSESDAAALMTWFKNYDALVAANDADGMIKEAHLPITVITDDSKGDCVAQQWDESAFRASIEGNVNKADTKIKNRRKPFFLNKNLAVVITESVVTNGDDTHYMRYADIMVKQGNEWKFKSMVQAGWGDMLKEYFGA
ncbi:MAG TPA: hypothetical protein VLA92_04080 [Candidatus Saccharimonadales bacterium]|nr:hypothetical protein [Candidatus Saccharimonadales bacterium]